MTNFAAKDVANRKQKTLNGWQCGVPLQFQTDMQTWVYGKSTLVWSWLVSIRESIYDMHSWFLIKGINKRIFLKIFNAKLQIQQFKHKLLIWKGIIKLYKR